MYFLISSIWLGTTAPGSTTDPDNGESSSVDAAGCLQDTRKAKKLLEKTAAKF
ncbi:MAG: hypothetical protein R3D26_22990 [Cyanobacteriota/Melainabacteria group bacterium]